MGSVFINVCRKVFKVGPVFINVCGKVFKVGPVFINVCRTIQGGSCLHKRL